MITRTFRMNPEYDKILNEEAEKQGITVSALLNQLIRQYVMVTRFTEKNPTITLTYRTFNPILDLIPDQSLIEAAEKTGAVIPEEALMMRGEKINLENICWLLEKGYGDYANWFDSFSSIIDGKQRFHLSHQMNNKWSTYVGAYMNSMFKSILDIDPRIEIRSNSVTIFLPKACKTKQLFKK